MNVDGTCGSCGAYCGGCSPMTAPDTTPTVREAGDEGIAAAIRAAMKTNTLDDGPLSEYLAAVLAPLIAEREAKAFDAGTLALSRALQGGSEPENPYRAAALPPEEVGRS